MLNIFPEDVMTVYGTFFLSFVTFAHKENTILSISLLLLCIACVPLSFFCWHRMVSTHQKYVSAHPLSKEETLQLQSKKIGLWRISRHIAVQANPLCRSDCTSCIYQFFRILSSQCHTDCAECTDAGHVQKCEERIPCITLAPAA